MAPNHAAMDISGDGRLMTRVIRRGKRWTVLPAAGLICLCVTGCHVHVTLHSSQGGITHPTTAARR